MKKFKDLEIRYNTLRKQAGNGEIDNATVNKELKKLMLMDDSGSYWIIGGNSGKWYKYDGKSWKEDNPYTSKELQQPKQEIRDTTRIIKNDIVQNKDVQKKQSNDSIEKEDDTDMVICKSCMGKINNFESYCHICGASQKKQELKQKPIQGKLIPELLISSVDIISLIFFFGGVGIIIGVIYGAITGIFKDVPTLIYLPQMLTNLRGNILGGILCAVTGGITGFIFSTINAILFGSLYNAISYFFGGIRFKTKK